MSPSRSGNGRGPSYLGHGLDTACWLVIELLREHGYTPAPDRGRYWLLCPDQPVEARHTPGLMISTPVYTTVGAALDAVLRKANRDQARR